MVYINLMSLLDKGTPTADFTLQWRNNELPVLQLTLYVINYYKKTRFNAVLFAYKMFHLYAYVVKIWKPMKVFRKFYFIFFFVLRFTNSQLANMIF